MDTWENGYKDGYARGVSDAVRAINKINDTDYSIWSVIVELLDEVVRENTEEAQ